MLDFLTKMRLECKIYYNIDWNLHYEQFETIFIEITAHLTSVIKTVTGP